MNQMDQNQSLKWIEMEQHIPTRVQFTKFNQNRKNPVAQIEPYEPKWIVKMDESKSKSLKIIQNLPKRG